MLQRIRAFFDVRNVLEIETPVLASAGVTDPHLDSMTLQVMGQTVSLNTSPEYCMKRFIAEHGCSVYQIARCFRQDECGPLHNPEFTLLEWYRIGFSLEQLMTEVGQLVTDLYRQAGLPAPALRRMTYAELFMQVTGLDPHQCSIEQLAGFCRHRQIDIPQGMVQHSQPGLAGIVERDAWLDWIMSTVVTPTLPADQLTTIHDYPASQCALARLAVDAAGRTVARRFECYLGTLELANGYDELTDADEQQQRFEQDNRKRELLGRAGVPADAKFLAALQAGLPDCAGVAVGLDRLLMAMYQLPSIDHALTYGWQQS